MKFLLKYLSKYKKESLLAPLFKMLEAIFELLVPIVMAQIIDVGIATGDRAYILQRCAILITFAVVGLVVAITAQYFAAKAAIYTAASIRKDLFSHIMDMSEESHGSVGTSALTTRITSDVNQIQNGINMVLRLFLRSPFIVLGALVMAGTINLKATLIFVIVIVLLSLIVAFIMKTTLPIFASIQKQMERIFLFVGENIDGVRVIRAFGNQEKQREGFEKQTGELYTRQMRAGRVSALLNPLTYVVVNIGIVTILWVGADMVGDGVLLTGEVVALVNYMSQILVELIKLANLIVLLMRCVPSVGRVREVLELPADERRHVKNDKNVTQSIDADESHNAENNHLVDMGATCQIERNQAVDVDATLVFDNVSFTYPDASASAISDISFTLGRGKRLGIIGGTGSGKSTILSLMHHAYDATEGNVYLDGKDIAAYSDEELSKRIGLVFQQAVLFAGTIRDNIVFGREDITEEDINMALSVAQAMDVVDSKTKGLSEEVLEGAKNFSGGQRQRLTIARALVAKPELIILDDASSALDAATDAALRAELAHLSWNPSVVIVSQRASAVLDADEILVMDGGKCVGYGTHDALLAENETYQEIYLSGGEPH